MRLFPETKKPLPFTMRPAPAASGPRLAEAASLTRLGQRVPAVAGFDGSGSYVDRQNETVDKVSEKFAESLVASLLEGF